MNQYPFNTDDELDDDIEDLQQLLGELRFVPRPLDLDSFAPPATSQSRVSRFSLTRHVYAASVAAGVALTFALAALWFIWFMPSSSIIVESSIEHSSQDSIVSPDTSPNIVNPSPARNDVNEASTFVPPSQAHTPHRSPRHAKFYPKRRAESANRVFAGLPPASAGETKQVPSSIEPEQAARELLLALDVTKRSLDATRQQIETHISALRIPVFPYPTQR
jgi:hypothetical protein